MGETRRQRTIAVAGQFQMLDKARQRELLANVCANMIENEAWDSIAELLVDQLGDWDAMIAVQS